MIKWFSEANFWRFWNGVYDDENGIVYYVPRRIIRVITRRATMLAGDRSRDKAEARSVLRAFQASLITTRIVGMGINSILCDFGAYTSPLHLIRPFWFSRSCVVVAFCNRRSLLSLQWQRSTKKKKNKKKITLRCMVIHKITLLSTVA